MLLCHNCSRQLGIVWMRFEGYRTEVYTVIILDLDGSYRSTTEVYGETRVSSNPIFCIRCCYHWIFRTVARKIILSTNNPHHFYQLSLFIVKIVEWPCGLWIRPTLRPFLQIICGTQSPEPRVHSYHTMDEMDDFHMINKNQVCFRQCSFACELKVVGKKFVDWWKIKISCQ